MLFILRTVFWLSLVSLFLPSDREASAELAAQAPAAQASADTSVCGENASLCRAGETAIALFGETVQLGAAWLGRIVFDEGSASGTAEAVDTLLPHDRQPAWRG